MFEELLMFDEGTPAGSVTPPEESTVPPVEPTSTQEPKTTKNDLLRELSQEHGVNLFDVEGLKKFKEFTESQKTELQKAQENIQAFETEKTSWQTKELEYQSKIKAMELGINQDNLEDALKLANGNPDNLQEVLKKYPMFANKQGIKIGVTDPNNNNQPSGQNEVEAYMAKNPKIYKNYKK